MSDDSYKILGLNYDTPRWEMSELPMSLRNVRASDDIVLKAYNSKLKELKIEYDKALDKLLNQKNNLINVLKYGIKSNKNFIKKLENQDKISKIEDEYRMKIDALRVEYNRKVEEFRNAFVDHLVTPESRELYKKCYFFKTERPFLNGNCAYDFFEISEQYIYSLNAKVADEFIKDVYVKRVTSYEKSLLKSNIDHETKKEIQTKLSLSHKFFKKICNMESRMKYKDELDLEDKKMEEKLIRDKCSKDKQFDPDLIKTIIVNDYNVKALKYKKSQNPVTLYLPDKKGRDILLTKTGEIVYRTSPSNILSYINEYEVSRLVNGMQRVDKIYANLDLPQLSVDEHTNRPNNPEYYDCVVNELLSEVVIRGSKYNKGYVGGVEKNKNGQYQILLAKKELDSFEKESLSAVMIYATKKEKEKIEKESDGER